MSPSETLYLIPYLGSVLMTASVSAYAFQKKDVRCARLLAWFSMAMSLSTAGFIIETIVPSLEAKIFWDDMQWLPESVVIVLALLITKEYSGESWKRPKLTYAAIAIPTLAISVLAFTDPWHGLMHKNAHIADSWPFEELRYTFTAPVYVFIAYLYAMFMYAILRMALVLRTPMGHHRMQILLMTLALAVPLLFSAITILELFPFIHRDLTPFSFAVSASLMALGIFRYKLLDVLPLARSLIVNSIPDAFVVIDNSCHIVDHNKAATPLFIGEQSSFVGEDAHKVLPIWNDGKEHGLDCQGETKTIKLSYSADATDYDITVVPILDGKNVRQAWLLTAHDLSGQKEIERSLRGIGAELEQEVTAKSERLTKLTRRLHKEEDEMGDVLLALQDSEEVYRSIFELARFGIVVRNTEGKALSANPEVLSIFGMTLKEFSNKSPFDLIAPKHHDTLKNALARIEEDGDASLSIEVVHKDGRHIQAEIKGRKFNIRGVIHVMFLIQDVTGHFQAMQTVRDSKKELLATLDALRGSESKFKTIFDLNSVGLTVRPMDGMPPSVNKEMLRIFGLSEKEYLACTLDDLICEENKADLKYLVDTLKDNNSAHIEARLHRKDGVQLDVDVVSQIIDLNGSSNMVTAIRDISIRKEASRKLENREAQLAKAQQVAKLAYWTIDPATGKIECSDEWFDILGIQQKEATIELVTAAIHPDSREEEIAKITEAIGQNEPFDVIHHLVLKNGETRYVHVAGEPVLSSDGQDPLYFGITQDITEEIVAKTAMQHLLSTTNTTGNEFFEALVTGLSTAFDVKYSFIGQLTENNNRVKTIALCADGKIIDGIEYELEGSPCTNVIGKKVCFHRQDVAKLFPDDELLVEIGAESYLGVPLWCDTGEPLGILALLGTSPMDKNAFPEDMLTILASRAAIELERQQTQTELLDNQHLLTSAESIGQTGSWSWNIMTNETVWSAGMYSLHGTTSEEFELTLESAFSRIHPDDVERLQDFMATGMAEAGVFEYEYRIIRLDDQVVRLKSRINYVKDVTGKPISANGIVRDITDEHKAKMQREDLLTQVTQLKDELEQERDYLRQELKVTSEFGAIIGDSEGTRSVLSKIEAVAGTDASVLISGASGVGKELVATAIHEKSRRRDGPLIKVNCASIPAELFESEFFGHVKGAFSGAVRDRVGRFQAADGGTLFLDEVGEIPLNLQSKLLRVLQESEFERVGDDRPRKVDVRVIAATNKNLEIESKAGRFRNDLFFRLNVFPLSVPTLAERKADILPLAMHFIERCCARFGRDTLALSRRQAEDLKAHDWPGNVRELQHVIERAMILSQGQRLRLDLAFNSAEDFTIDLADSTKGPVEYMTDNEMRSYERRNTIAVLDATNWVISGTDGAAARLGIKPSTLTSRMKKMNISKPEKSNT